ncbi:aminotransferase class I/II-fold pyridoxal phosphate-dependent enzyme [Salinadaptatus halalkaliphilus]|uniref:aminotransferase class I/II-fold pyridoxal phosphate-dependent enzyme n=1 Tax=Salinadaptatus halalkaliphilus TaxID=2419781 RepID=UPI001580F360|nr:aminotransferase class I/II-fold pyridoxal phosphate-dependent enzyme [Salinadaptatus halalkaliphilus]
MDPEAVRAGERVPHGGETDPAVLDFSANTNPHTPDGVADIYADALEASRRYPDDAYPDFRAAAAAFVGCEPEAVVPTPGGLAAIRLAIETSLAAGDEVLVPAPSFGEYAREVELQGAKPRFVAHDELLAIEDAALESAALAIVCTPNNPTGEAIAFESLEAFANRCRTAETTLLIDEAFLGFTDRRSAATLAADHVVVARSLTKLFGLPGLRAGFTVASGTKRDTLETARRAWSLGTPAARVGAYCLRQPAFVERTRRRVERERERLREALEGRFDVAPSDAPFLLCDVGSRDVDSILESARADGVAVRDARTFRGLDSHVRVAIKDPAANDAMLGALGVDRTGSDGDADDFE